MVKMKIRKYKNLRAKPQHYSSPLAAWLYEWGEAGLRGWFGNAYEPILQCKYQFKYKDELRMFEKQYQ